MGATVASVRSAVTGDERRFHELLTRWRSLALEHIEAAIPAREPRRHLYDLVRAHMGRAGKGLRPALCIATARAFGADETAALPSAAALELLHNAFLVHDDIEDGSAMRRGHPTMAAEHGIPLAVNTGDAMNALSTHLLQQNLESLGAPGALRVFAEVDTLLLESLEGQAIELGWIEDNTVDVRASDYLRMTLKKTCRYSFIHPMRIGALVADAQRDDLERFDAFGFFLGAAFQIQDDVLNLTGDHRYGKEIDGDLSEGKRTLILAHLFERVTPDESRALADFFGRPRTRRLPREVHWIHSLLDRHGSIDYARSAASALASAAADQFDQVFAGATDGDALAFLRGLLAYAVERDL